MLRFDEEDMRCLECGLAMVPDVQRLYSQKKFGKKSFVMVRALNMTHMKVCIQGKILIVSSTFLVFSLYAT